mmetsp:Transcript_20245/g.22633  ORF Transcript_20245/g.22633 Transcript_20245/m.22633 type:complete len:87 (-) Transcript_20245:174-434(-)
MISTTCEVSTIELMFKQVIQIKNTTSVKINHFLPQKYSNESLNSTSFSNLSFPGIFDITSAMNNEQEEERKHTKIIVETVGISPHR